MKDLLKGLEFFQCLNEQELDALSLHVDILDFNLDEVLFYRGELKQNFLYLLSGEIKVYRVDRFDNEIFLYRLDENSMITDFIDISTLTCKKCFANAVFTKESKILSIENSFFVSMLKENAPLYKNLVNESYKRLQRLENIINRDVVYDATSKVAHMLDTDLSRFNTLKKHEIAYELHIQPETLSRILAKMVRNSLIKIQKSKVEILDQKELKQIY
nr:Crp/Fnr family transcriptional regulator [Campylobacteraceae bacterium]